MFRLRAARSSKSDYYQIRRASIRDFFGVVGFLVGFIGFGPYGWPMLQEGVASGDMAAGLLRFFGVVLAGGIGIGVAGLLVGIVVGYGWELVHRSVRPAPQGDPEIAGPRERARDRAGKPELAWAVQYDTGPLTSEAYRDLERAVAHADGSTAPAAEPDALALALERTENFTAWRDGALVGVLRVFSDGMAATVVDIMVRPDHRRLGVARELLRRALAAAPRGEIRLAPQGQLLRFFQSLGPARESSGLILKRSDFRG